VTQKRVRPMDIIDYALHDYAALGRQMPPADLHRAVDKVERLRRKAKKWDARHQRPASMGKGH
jgi:hypothetical protein